MSGRLPSGVAVAALIRRVNDAGGLGVVRARGDREGGGILLILEAVGQGPARLLERRLDLDGTPTLAELPGGDDAEAYWRRRRARDPDLWVVALDVAGAERFAAETILAR